MNDIPDNMVAVIAIVVLGVIAGAALLRDFNHGILQSVIITIAGLAGYKIRGIVDEKSMENLKQLIESGTQQETEDTA